VSSSLKLDIRTASELQITKGLFYSIVKSSEFDAEEGDLYEAPSPERQLPDATTKADLSDDCIPPSPVSPSSLRSVLSPAHIRKCRLLMTRMIAYFTPILFTPSVTPHMTCTDVFADAWMTFVVIHAIQNQGVYKPLETLQYIADVDWAAHGLCTSCVTEKRREWKAEQENVWSLLDEWLK
jgi:hypothetical protein